MAKDDLGTSRITSARTGFAPLGTTAASIAAGVEARRFAMSEAARAEAQRIAESAGFSFVLPLATRSVIGTYRPAAPEFARMGALALYTRACVDLALALDPHANAAYARCVDPIAHLCRTLAHAECDSNSMLAAHKARALERLIADVLAASRRDPDRLRRLSFAAALHRDVGCAFLDIGTELRVASGNLACGLALLNRASDQFDRAMVFVDAMRGADAQTVAAE